MTIIIETKLKFAHVVCDTCVDLQIYEIDRMGSVWSTTLFPHARSRLRRSIKAYLFLHHLSKLLSETLKIGQLNGIFSSETMCHQKQCIYLCYFCT